MHVRPWRAWRLQGLSALRARRASSLCHAAAGAGGGQIPAGRCRRLLALSCRQTNHKALECQQFFFQSENFFFPIGKLLLGFCNLLNAGEWAVSQIETADVIVIGAGIAGAGVAAELAQVPGAERVILLERESQPGYHTTGRSAALYTTAYGPRLIRALTRASYRFYSGKGPGEPPQELIKPRGSLFVARDDQAETLAELQQELGAAVVPMNAAQLREKAPLLRDGYASAGAYEALAADIDVAALHQHYLRRFKANGGR